MEPRKISKIGKYEVLEVLGKGGMGVVYKATDPAIGRLVAIKVITTGLAENPDSLKRFYREAQSTGRLQHQNIVIVHELGEQDGAPFLVMEFLEGESLQSVIVSRRPLPLLDKLNFIIQTCNGLHYAHEHGIVHRDIKSANLMLLKDGLIKIVDFGIARFGNESVTLPGQVMGSMHYMSPEQLTGVRVDRQTDIFSTGVVLYQLLTYTLPFQGHDTGSTLLKIANEPPPPLGQFLQTYPQGLDYVLSRALAKLRADRYPTAEEFAVDLSHVHDQLKRELVANHQRQAEELIARSEFAEAREQILKMLKVDRQNRRAKEMLANLQRLMEQRIRNEQVNQLRTQAEDALSRRQPDRALTLLEQALAISPQNSELKQLRDQTREAKLRFDNIRDALKRAESAQWAGELDEALAAVEEARNLDMNDAEVITLHDSLTRQLSERQRRSQLQELLDQAQRQITSRRYTGAIEFLQKAESLDPSAPAVKEMMSLALSRREQERRRQELEQVSSDIQEAIDREDYSAACELADRGLERFPDDRGLTKLKDLAEKEQQASQRSQFVQEQISRARKLMEESRTDEALQTLEVASKRFPTERLLAAMLTTVRENQQQEHADARKRDYLRRAKEALRKKHFQEATAILETAHAELGAPEIDDLLQFAKHEYAAQERQRVLDAAVQEAHRLMSVGCPEDGVNFLKSILQDVSDEELEITLADAERQLSEFNRRVKEAVDTGERLLSAGRVSQAVRYLDSQAEVCGAAAEFRAVLERARHQQERTDAVADAVQSAQAALSEEDFAGAAKAIEVCQKSVGEHPDLSQMARQIDSRRRDAASKAVSAAVTQLRILLLGRSYAAAVDLHRGVSGWLGLAPSEVCESYLALHQEAIRGLQRTGAKPTSQETEIQISPPIAGSGQPRQNEFELTQVARDSEGDTNWASLDSVSQRVRPAAQPAAASEVQPIAGHSDDADQTYVVSYGGDASPMHRAEASASSVSAAPEANMSETVVRPSTVPDDATVISLSPGSSFRPAQQPVPISRRDSSMVPAVTESTARKLEVDMPAADSALSARPVAVPGLALPEHHSKRLLVILVAASAGLAMLLVGLFMWRLNRTAQVHASPVLVHTVPEGATVRVMDTTCVTPNCKLDLKPGAYHIDAVLRGYAPGSTTVEVEAGKAPPTVNIALQPVQPALHIDANFTNAKVLLDDKESGSLKDGPVAIEGISPGEHAVKIDGPDGEADFAFAAIPARAPVLAKSLRGNKLSILVVSTLGGSARVDCNCAGTQPLSVDGHPSGDLTDAGRDLGELGEGVHELKLGTGDSARTISAKLGAGSALDVFLNAERSSGTLLVDADVEDADVIANGRRYHYTSGTLRIPLDATWYNIRMEKQGYQPVAPQHVHIQKDQEAHVTFKLAPMDQKAYVGIRGGMAGAKISVDGTPVGVIGADGQFYSPGLEPGDHVIKIEKEGYQSRVIEVPLKAGEILNLSGEEIQMPKGAPTQPNSTG